MATSPPNYNVKTTLNVDLTSSFECDWLIELSDNKLSDNKNRSF